MNKSKSKLDFGTAADVRIKISPQTAMLLGGVILLCSLGAAIAYRVAKGVLCDIRHLDSDTSSIGTIAKINQVAPIGKIPIGKIPIGKIPIGKIPIGKIKVLYVNGFAIEQDNWELTKYLYKSFKQKIKKS